MSRRPIEMRQLEFFLQVADCKSATKAAEALQTAQPNVSRTIRELEQLVGNRLFERSSEGVSLTPAGQALPTYVRPGMTQISVSSVESHELPTQTGLAQRSASPGRGAAMRDFAAVDHWHTGPEQAEGAGVQAFSFRPSASADA